VETGLSFPGSAPSEVEFRDGKRLVPAHLAPFLERIETHRMTYEEAVVIVNKMMESDYLNAQGDSFVAAHFRENR